MPNIGILIEVDVRALWKHEQYDFSNWLARPANLEYLNEILGLTLVDVDKEVYVGPYRCDLVAKDETSGITVIIENQLEGTNHDHLGKIITYASGLDAKVMVWIVREAKEEHRAAIEWLNNNTAGDINTVAVGAVLIANADVSEDDVYNVISGIYENADAITKAHSKGAELNIEAAAAITSAPYHSGAAKYFGEKGITVK